MYRAIDRDGNLIDTLLSPTRDLAAAKAFFQQAVAHVGEHAKPEAEDKAHRRAIGLRKYAFRDFLRLGEHSLWFGVLSYPGSFEPSVCDKPACDTAERERQRRANADRQKRYRDRRRAAQGTNSVRVGDMTE